MSLQTPSMTGAAGDCCVEGEGEVLTVPKPRAVRLLSVYLTVKPVGEPDALIGYVRFDERGWETERRQMAQATAPILDSTKPAVRGQAEYVRSARVFQTSTCSAIARASSSSMPRYLTVLSILVCPSKSWTALRLPVRR